MYYTVQYNKFWTDPVQVTFYKDQSQMEEMVTQSIISNATAPEVDKALEALGYSRDPQALFMTTPGEWFSVAEQVLQDRGTALVGGQVPVNAGAMGWKTGS